MKRIIDNKHPLAIRWFHWVNFPLLGIMIWSGLLIYWAYHPYKIQVGDWVLVKFFPDWLFIALKLRRRLAEGMAWHFVFMWLFMLNGLFYVGYTWLSGEWRYLIPDRHSFREAWDVVLHDLGIRKIAPLQTKYNAAQKIAYSGVILMGLGSLLTGLAIYKPIQFAWVTWLFGGYTSARVIHFALTMGYLLFFVVHILQVIRAGWNNFRSMVAGFDVIDYGNTGQSERTDA
ncbi:cytochrome b/b6 domain-containing protein [Arsenicibacter rosenii]|uniref:Thiosulfate reductase n=1 Tax=Arsenicibacter rosenii TaxID=1750698 RepID=A0A1S2VJN9_9BACT|nr:cytochrome b/b6 domain-containing protein [Arsenicibacter rosenii]OIN58038.1 thiosulfate reductase [Arsenicibacter rosenii]